jgi:hypothetical protein
VGSAGTGVLVGGSGVFVGGAAVGEGVRGSSAASAVASSSSEMAPGVNACSLAAVGEIVRVALGVGRGVVGDGSGKVGDGSGVAEGLRVAVGVPVLVGSIPSVSPAC